jgi:SAM-dependent methyltransferase
MAGVKAMLTARLQADSSGFAAWDCLDIGGQAVNGDARAIFGPDAAWDVLDIVEGPGVTIVADATEPATWAALVGRYDLVLCTEVLEHVERWEQILDCCAYALKPHGTLILTCASTHRAPHGANGEPTPDGQWYGNVDPQDLQQKLDVRFEQAHTAYQYPPGDAYAWAYRPRG